MKIRSLSASYAVKRLGQTCLVLLAVCLTSIAQAWAESPYSRDQVERHLRAMFVNIDMPSLPADVPVPQVQGFDLLVEKKVIRLYVSDIEEKEVEPTIAIFNELFVEIIDVPTIGVDPFEGQEFDLFIYLSDNLGLDASTPKYKSLLKASEQSEGDYLNSMRSDPPGSGIIVSRRYFRTLTDPFVVVAAEREAPQYPESRPYGMLMRHTLFHALTGARVSNVIKPSVVNPSPDTQKMEGFAPIDRAVLRAIFGHDDWSGLDYDSKIQLLTDRVMAQLAMNP